MGKTTPELLDVDNFERWQEGKPLKKEKPPKMPEPEPPQVKNTLTMENLKIEDVGSIPSAKRKPVRNKEGVIFVGFDVVVNMKNGKRVAGWMPAKDFHEFRHALFKKGEVALDKISI